jgi:hypothetical protein
VIEAADQSTADFAHPKSRSGKCLLNGGNQRIGRHAFEEFESTISEMPAAKAYTAVVNARSTTKHIDDNDYSPGVARTFDSLHYLNMHCR